MKYPSVFIGHGSPMIALEKSETTDNFKKLGAYLINNYGKPKAILSISAHWFTRGNFIQKEENPRQIYDMYGFPEELYEIKYPVRGDFTLTNKVKDLIEDIDINNEWGIDHGSWTVLKHIFPNADIPVVQLSVNGLVGEEEIFSLGKKLESLRNEGYLILGSGNIVHNLMKANWEVSGGSLENKDFDEFIVKNILDKNYKKIINHRNNPNSLYAVPTKEHFYPLLYVLGASKDGKVKVFNREGRLSSISMSSFIFE